MTLKRADLHVHTSFSRWKHFAGLQTRDCYSDPLDVYHRAKQVGMDFVAITDHDTIEGALDLLGRRPDLEPEIIVGEEVETYFPGTGQWVHVNVFGLDEQDHAEISRLRQDVFDLVAYLRERRLFHVLNHPFQSHHLLGSTPEYVETILRLFDGFEVRNAALSCRHNRAVSELLEYASITWGRRHAVGGSDAHVLSDIGLCHTEAPVPAGAAPGADKTAWLAAVARGEGQVVGRSISAARLAANIFRVVGRYYLSLLDGEVRRKMTPAARLVAALYAPTCLLGLPAWLSLGNTVRLEAVTLQVRHTLKRMQSAELASLPSPGLLEDPQE